MARPYLGLRGSKLINVAIAIVVSPAYILLGYNNAVMGGLLTLPSFLTTFPSIDTVNTSGSEEAENARIQGMASTNLLDTSHVPVSPNRPQALWSHSIR